MSSKKITLADVSDGTVESFFGAINNNNAQITNFATMVPQIKLEGQSIKSDPVITISRGNPTGGNTGDIWIKVE